MKNDVDTPFPCIIPTLPEDYKEVKDGLYMLFDKLSVSKLIFIGNNELNELVIKDEGQLSKEDKVEFINENDIIPFENVKEAYSQRLRKIEETFGKPEKISRAGWYYQQFLKMEYSKYCSEDYYLCWDADTVPLRDIEMFSESGVPFLDIKPEYNPVYFDTLKRLLKMDKVIEASFISEHMLIKTRIMKELIDDIMEREIKGTTFYEKIFSAINIPFNGFSEFETYGTYAACKFTSAYKLRSWKSIRNTGFMINRTELSGGDLKWLATGFDAASFERYHEEYPELNELFRRQEYRNKLRADQFYEELLKAGVFGDYRNGGLVVGDMLCPV